MPELMATIGAIVAGASCGVAMYAIAGGREGIDAASWLARRRQAQPAPGADPQGPWSKALDVAGARNRLVSVVDRAGWKESPERVAAFALALSGCTAVLGVASASVMPVSSAAVLGVLGFVSGLGSCALALRSAVAGRRRRAWVRERARILRSGAQVGGRGAAPAPRRRAGAAAGALHP